jgi:hypothetical protein
MTIKTETVFLRDALVRVEIWSRIVEKMAYLKK